MKGKESVFSRGRMKFLALVCLAPLAASCVSVRVYEKTTRQVIENDVVIAEDTKLLLDRKLKESTSKSVTEAETDGMKVVATTESSSKKSYNTMNIKLYKNGTFIAERDYKVKDGELVRSSSGGSSSGGSGLSAEDREYVKAVDYDNMVLMEGGGYDMFFISKTEVTQEEWQKVMGTNPSSIQGERLPVTNVSFFESLDYCNKLSQKEGLVPAYTVSGTNWNFNKRANGYRLPMNTEWRYAAIGGKFGTGAGKTQKYSGSNSAGDVAWYKGNSKEKTHEVATKKPNQLGIYDMSGNVSEWCWTEGGGLSYCGGSYLEAAEKNTVYSSGELENKKYKDVGFRIARFLTKAESRAFEEKQELLSGIDSYFYNAYMAVMERKTSGGGAEDSNLKYKMRTEKVTVESFPDKNYIVYSILGKPFVIAGSTAWSLLKCAGYACINFIGGYNTVSGNGFLWKMPDTKAAKEKAAKAREENKIKNYPEYHLPFTYNHITARIMEKEDSQEFFAIDPKDVAVKTEDYEHTNPPVSVKHSASADANSTSATIGMVGTVITVPVSFASWLGGAAMGVYGSVAGKK